MPASAGIRKTMNIWGRNKHSFWTCFPTASQGRSRDGCRACVHACVKVTGLLPRLSKAQELSRSSAPRCGRRRGLGSSRSRAGSRSCQWEGKCHCDLPRSLPSAGSVMLLGNCWPNMSVPGTLPLSVSQTRRRPYLEQLGWAGPAGRRAGEESGHDGETSQPALARDARAGAG